MQKKKWNDFSVWMLVLLSFHFIFGLLILSFFLQKFFVPMFRAMEKPIENTIRAKIESAFKPITFFEVINESSKHNVPKGSETHFKLTIITDHFNGMGLIDRHRKVHDLLSEELKGGVHALSLVTKTPEQWAKNSKVEASPNCLGGMKQEMEKKL